MKKWIEKLIEGLVEYLKRAIAHIEWREAENTTYGAVAEKAEELNLLLDWVNWSKVKPKIPTVRGIEKVRKELQQLIAESKRTTP